MKCEFKQICNSLYSEPLSEYCCLYKNEFKICKLIKSIQEGKVSSFVLDLIGKISENEKSNEKLFEVTCPRSASNISINKACNLTSCPYFADKMSYNCMLIHKDIFFYDNEELPSKLMEISSGLTFQEFNRIIELGIYQSRVVILLLTYNKEETDRICPICSYLNPFNNLCDCIENKELRKKRINFDSNWKKALLKEKETFDVKKMKVKTLASYYDIFSIEFVRSWINYPLVEKNLSDLPFGYVFCTYFKLFNNNLSSSMENIGLTDKLFKKALILFPIKGHISY